LASVDIFADLSEAQLTAIAAAAAEKSFAAGDRLFSARQRVESLFILKRGRVRTFMLSGDGRTLTTAILEPGTVFGAMAAMPDQQVCDNFAEAVDQVTVSVLSRADVHRLLWSDARIASRISAILGRRVLELERRLSDAVFKSVPERVASALILLAGKADLEADRGAQVTLTHQEIAAVIGASREAVTRVLGEYADRGLLRLGRGTVTILDPGGVAAEAGL